MATTYQDINKMLSWQNGGTAINASATYTSDNTGTAVTLGKGRFDLFVDVTALTLGTGFDTVTLVVERNTAAATSTWISVCPPIVIGGDATGAGEAVGVGDYVVGLNNTGDHQIRIKTYLSGSATSVTYSATAYPVASKDS